MKWEVQIPKGFKEHRNIVTSEGVKVATVWEDGANTESTAQLLAAAPELLEALETLLQMDEAHAECCKKAIRAIAKAKGE